MPIVITIYRKFRSSILRGRWRVRVRRIINIGFLVRRGSRGKWINRATKIGIRLKFLKSRKRKTRKGILIIFIVTGIKRIGEFDWNIKPISRWKTVTNGIIRRGRTSKIIVNGISGKIKDTSNESITLYDGEDISTILWTNKIKLNL